MDIPAGTVVGAPGSSARFATDRSGRVASGPGTTIALPVTALTPGSRGNLPPESIQAIEGQLGTSLAVTNPQPTSGGTDQISPAVTPLDQTRLYNQLAQVLQNEASADIQDLLTSGDILLTPEPSLARTVEKSFDPASLGPASQLNLTMMRIMEATGFEALFCGIGWRNYYFAKVTTAESVVGWSEFDQGVGSPGVTAVVASAAPRGGRFRDAARVHPRGASCVHGPGPRGVVGQGENGKVLNGLREHLATIRPDACAPGWLIDVDILEGEAL